MVLGIGLISAVILAKKGPKSKTRLQKLQHKLDNKPIKNITFYQIPSKRLFSIMFIIFLILFLNYFQENYLYEIIDAHQSESIEIEKQSLQAAREGYGKICEILKWIKIAYAIMIFAIISDLKFKIVSVQDNIITTKLYNRSKLGEMKKIVWGNEQLHMQIVRGGQEKFTHNTGHFLIQAINSKNQEKYQILKRADIFHARKALIQIANVLSFKPDLKIY